MSAIVLDVLLDRYVAVWNEPDPGRRRAAIESLWLPDGAHLTPTRQAVGWDAIEERIAEAYQQWVAPGGFEFRAVPDISGHNSTARFHWEMAPPDGPAASVGFDFLILADDGRIHTDYQSIEQDGSDPGLRPLLDRYVAVWNEPDAGRRRAAIESLWLPDGAHLTPTRQAVGWDAIEERIAEAYQQWVAPGGFDFRAVPDISGHNSTARFHWEMAPPDGPAASVGFDFLILADDGRIHTDYQSIEG